MDRHQALSALSEISCGINPPYPHWLGGDDVDQGPSYCRDCAQAKVDAGDAEFIDGGWVQDSDSPCFCESCQKPLDYTLTDHGAQQELAHYKACPPQLPLSAHQAYCFEQLLSAMPDNAEMLAVLDPILTPSLRIRS